MQTPKPISQELVVGGILVGGQSRRMGSPKSLLQHQTRSFFESAVQALLPWVSECYGVGSGPVPDEFSHLPIIEDDPNFPGPMAGIAGALSALSASWIFLATDMPLITSKAIGWLMGQRGSGRAIILPRSDRGFEPFPSLFEKGSLEMLLPKVKAPRRLGGTEGVYSPLIPSELWEEWRNINSPEDVHRLKRRDNP